MKISINVDLDKYTYQELLLTESNSISATEIKKDLHLLPLNVGNTLYLHNDDITPKKFEKYEEAKVREGLVYFGRYNYLCDGITITHVSIDLNNNTINITAKL